MRSGETSAEHPDRISAEITPRTGQAQRAATALRARGFRVLSTGTTISVDAPRPLWTRVFGDPTGNVPESLRDLVAGVAVVPPPDLH